MNNCPICYSKFVIKPVTPCYVCGGWNLPSNLVDKAEYIEYTLEDDRKITLCTICYLEEFLADQGDSDEFIGAKGDDLRFQRIIETESKEKDKYCEECKKRLALLKLKK